MLKFDYQSWLENWRNPTDGDDPSADITAPEPGSAAPSPVDPTAPDLHYLKENFAEALQSFYATIARIIADNPVDAARLGELAGKAQAGAITPEEGAEFHALRLAAQRQGRAVGGVYGFFLKYRPYPMLTEIKAREKLFQPLFGPVLVVDGDSVREVLTRHDEFTVDPYGREMKKSMTPGGNGGFDTFILSTDDPEEFTPDKTLLTTVVNKDDPAKITDLVLADCLRRVGAAVADTRGDAGQIDIVSSVARFVPVTVAQDFFGIPVAARRGQFDLTDEMLKFYGSKVAGPDGTTPLPTTHTRPDGSKVDLPDTALAKGDGVIPDEETVYEWIKAAFQNFFNNVQKDIEVQARGVRAYRELLAYLLRELDIQRAALKAGNTVPDTMMTRLLRLQMGLADPALTPCPAVDPVRLSNLRIAENVMGTVVGAIAGQEEATCRMVDSMIRLKEGDFSASGETGLCGAQRQGSHAEAQQLALDVLEGRNVAQSRQILQQYALEALRLQPQAEILLRECRTEGAKLSGSRPIRAGTLIFTAHGAAMQDTEHADAFIIGRDDENYLQYGYGRHKCLGQYISPVILVETLIAVLALDNLRRPAPGPDDSAFPLERRFGRLQLDDNNLYARSFTLTFDHGGTTDKYFS